MAEWERRYADKPVHFFHVLCGENPVQALDYKKHYRLDAPHLLDTTYAVSNSYKAGSWPTSVLVDAEGNLAGRWPGALLDEKNRPAMAKTLDDVLTRAKGGPPKGAYCSGTTCFVRSAQHTFEQQPTLTADGHGRLHLVFVRDTGGSGDLFHQVYDGKQWSEPARITRSAADDYSPFVCRDGPDAPDAVRLVWCSNRAASGKYDVWTRRFDGATWSAPEAVTQTDDDAAHPRATVDARGNFWVTYYRWIRWANGQSRDREIFVRYHDGTKWSDELQLSPTDVPAYEDHADPSVAADAGGNVWVAWAWDTHPEAESWPFAPTFGSTIFARQLRAGQPPSRLQMVAMRAQSIQAAMNNPTWAFLPEVYCRGDQPWFVFESHSPESPNHACTVTRYEPDQGFPAPERLGLNATFVCTTRLVEDRTGRLVALWSAPAGEHFAVHLAILDRTGQWGDEKTVWADPKADVRFPTAAFDADNRLWVAAVQTTLGHSGVVVQPISLPEAAPAGPTTTGPIRPTSGSTGAR